MTTMLHAIDAEDDLFDSGADAKEEPSATYVIFEIGSQGLAADVTHVREILDMMPILPLPNAPPDILGMIDVRGEGIAVIDLQDRLNLLAQGNGTARKVIILDLQGQLQAPARPIGIIADMVRSVVDIAPVQIESAPQTIGRWQCPAMTGVARLSGNLIYVLDLHLLFAAGSNAAGQSGDVSSPKVPPCAI